MLKTGKLWTLWTIIVRVEHSENVGARIHPG